MLIVSDVLPAKISGGRVKEEIMKLPAISIDFLEANLESEDEIERAVLVYAFLSSAYLNGDKGIDTDSSYSLFCVVSPGSQITGGKIHQSETRVLPSLLAVPLKFLSDKVGRPPILTYASCVLFNWRVINPEEEISLDNITISGRFLGM